MVYEQLILVQDVSNPTITTMPENITINCSDNIPTIVLPQASDNCDGDVNVVLEQETTTQTNNGSNHY